MTSGARSRLVVGVAAAEAEHEVAARARVGVEQVEQHVVGDVERGDDEHRPARHERVGVAAEMLRVDDVSLQAGAEQALVEAAEDPVVGARVGLEAALDGERGMELHRPLALARVQEAGVGVGDEVGHRRAGAVELAGDPLDLVVAAPGLAVVVEDAEPVRLVAEVVRVPVPVLDHARAAGHERPRRLAPLAVIGGEVRVRLADRGRVRLGHEERLVAGGARLIGLQVDHPGAGLPRPARGAQRGLRRRRRHRERALHRVVGVDRGDVELAVEVGGIERRARQRHARRDELIRPARSPSRAQLARR